MASIKEIQQSARPLVHRPSAALNNAAASGSLAAGRGQPHSRSSSHSVLAPSLNSTNHRVTRRKSITNSGANRTAMVAALQEAVAMPLPSMTMPITISAGPGHRRNTLSSKPALSRSVGVGSLPSPPPSYPLPKLVSAGNKLGLITDSAIDDEAMEMDDASGTEGEGGPLDQARERRASDSQSTTAKEAGGGGRKFNRPELHCDKCGKGYKHSSCLIKHLWEHTPEWSYTSKLLISKHQQVQLLEAATVLLNMNTGPNANANAEQPAVVTPPESALDAFSDHDSLSPAASSASYPDYRSSVDTTPPPVEGLDFSSTPYTFAKMRAADFARPVQSALSGFSFAQSMPGAIDLARRPSQDRRPPSSGTNATGRDDHELAAGIKMLSCSANSASRSSSSGAAEQLSLLDGPPPVPAFPAQYLEEALASASFINSFPSRATESFTRGGPVRGEAAWPSRMDVRMEESGDDSEDVLARSEEEFDLFSMDGP